MRRGNLTYVKAGRRRLITRHHLQQFLGDAPPLGNRRPCGQAERRRASSPLYDCRLTTWERPRSRAVPMALDHVRAADTDIHPKDDGV